jgi:dTDP-4-dehydrorhamnose 3,5-epimerase
VTLSIANTEIDGVRLVTGTRLADPRGFLERVFCVGDLGEILQGRTVVQVNHTRTVRKGTVRGLHFQYPPAAEMKLVHCLSGSIFDVAADLRAGSPTQRRWHGEILSADEPKTLVIPEGVAHGFQLLSDSCDILYFHTAPYRREAEGGVNACDPALSINWPLPLRLQSERDAGLPMLDCQFTEVAL